MPENSIERLGIDFVARDIKNNIVCVSGSNDNFTAINSNGKWETGYRGFEDLMDNFSEEKDLEEIQKIASEARKVLMSI